MHKFSPFRRPIEDLTCADAAGLREIAEGWYVEYKRELPNARSAAKSLSALANQYGGWVVYGVIEKGDGSRTAGTFPGIPRAEVPLVEQRLRERQPEPVL
jgi:predicted HTH transcriptional regulator